MQNQVVQVGGTGPQRLCLDVESVERPEGDVARRPRSHSGQAGTVAQVEREWTRPYRAGLVVQALWWFDLVLAVPVAAFGVVVVVVGAAGGEMPLVVTGAFLVVLSVVVFVGAWRLLRCGVWTGPAGVQVRTLARRARAFPWSTVRGFDVRPGASVLPFIAPAPQVAIIVDEEPPVLVPGLWRGSPMTWGSAGPTRIVEALHDRRPAR